MVAFYQFSLKLVIKAWETAWIQDPNTVRYNAVRYNAVMWIQIH